jgi:prephenate dehydrogenase
MDPRMPETPLFEKVALLGIGLMGGSLGLALRASGLAAEVVGTARRPETRETALRLGLITEAKETPEEAVRDADLTVLAAPLRSYESLLRSALPALKPGSVVTDLGSVKTEPTRICERLLKDSGVSFVGGHPMTGSEASGPEAARADLYEGAVWCLTPTDATDSVALAKIQLLAESVGSRVIALSPEEHDRAVAATSHLPHLAAVALISALDVVAADAPVAAMLTAGGFRDTTRVASGSPPMWRDICLANRDSILKAIGIFREALDAMEAAVRREDGPALEAYLEAARSYREKIVKPEP